MTAESGRGVYISLDTLKEWREDAMQRASRADSHLVFASRIVALIDALEAPCGSCHPCSHWAAETWRQAGGELPHKHTVDEWRERAARCDALEHLLSKVVDYWDGRPLHLHGHHIYQDLIDALRAVRPVQETTPTPPGGASNV